MSRKIDFQENQEIFVKSSKQVQTCLVSVNDDFDDKSTYIYCFLHEKYFLDKNFYKWTLWFCGRKVPNFRKLLSAPAESNGFLFKQNWSKVMQNMNPF